MSSEASNVDRFGFPRPNEGEFATDEFRMYEFKVRPCHITVKHEWRDCPNYHPNERARRRDPRKHMYSPLKCVDFRVARSCYKGDDCEFAHGMFKTWLHPAQYRTKVCKYGAQAQCREKVCFFAHDENELRPIYKSTGSISLQEIPPIAGDQRIFDGSDAGGLYTMQQRFQSMGLSDNTDSLPLGMFQGNARTGSMEISSQFNNQQQQVQNRSMYQRPNAGSFSAEADRGLAFLPNAYMGPRATSHSITSSNKSRICNCIRGLMQDHSLQRQIRVWDFIPMRQEQQANSITSSNNSRIGRCIRGLMQDHSL